MTRKLNKICMVVVATVMFAGSLFLSVEKNEEGKWVFGILQASAQGGEYTIVQFYHYGLETVTAGVNNFAEGRAQVHPYYVGGVAAVITPSYTYQSIIYTKVGDNSTVMVSGAPSYFIGYSAHYTTIGSSAGTIVVMDTFEETI